MSSGLGMFIAQRLASALLTMVGAILFLFVIIQFVPGDLVSILLGPRATPELRAAFAERMGLDRPILEQAWLFFARPCRATSAWMSSPTGRSSTSCWRSCPTPCNLPAAPWCWRWASASCWAASRR